MRNITTVRNAQWLSKLLLIILAVALASTVVSALGVKPAQQLFHYASDTEYKGQFTVLRDTPEKSIAQLSAEGELADYVSFPTEYVTLEGQETKIEYAISLPKGLSPGEHVTRILISQALTPGADGIGSRIVLPFTIRINVPYPEKFVKASLEVIPTGSQLTVAATVENLGEKTVDSVTPRVSITDVFRQQVTTIPLDAEPLGLFEKKTFEKTVDIGKLKNGIYRATAAIAYDDNTVAVVKDFTIGVPIIGVLSKEKFFKAGDVSPFTMDVENQWNAPLKNVVATLIVTSKGQEVAGVRTDPFDLEIREHRHVTAYLDARKLVPGTYDAVLTITYEGGSVEDPYTIEVLAQDAYVDAIKSESQGITVSWTFAGLTLLLLFNAGIAVFIVSRMLSKKPESNSAEKAIADFVKKARSMGFDDDHIRDQLGKTGWPKTLIDNVLGRKP